VGIVTLLPCERRKRHCVQFSKRGKATPCDRDAEEGRLGGCVIGGGSSRPSKGRRRAAQGVLSKSRVRVALLRVVQGAFAPARGQRSAVAPGRGPGDAALEPRDVGQRQRIDRGEARRSGGPAPDAGRSARNASPSALCAPPGRVRPDRADRCSRVFSDDGVVGPCVPLCCPLPRPPFLHGGACRTVAPPVRRVTGDSGWRGLGSSAIAQRGAERFERAQSIQVEGPCASRRDRAGGDAGPRLPHRQHSCPSLAFPICAPVLAMRRTIDRPWTRLVTSRRPDTPRPTTSRPSKARRLRIQRWL